jgi:acetyl/propionyl-CoA carboxylase alpha subunit/acetyl-CoA carboxylase carboxyltransferase component
MSVTSLLIANRGEIAIRIARAAAELGIRSVAVYSQDDAASRHRVAADVAAPLRGNGVPAYLDARQLLALAAEHGCDAVHPGYGFLSENPDFSAACEQAGLTFVGPSPQMLRTFGDKTAARRLAQRCGVPLLPGSHGPVDLGEATSFVEEHGPIVLKAVAGGGGRGMRVVRTAGELQAAFPLCQREAQAAFGDAALYCERLIERARHVEVQVLGDGAEVTHLWERECSLQRRHQKLIEIAPSPSITPALRAQLIEAALAMAAAEHYRGLGTFEFLLDAEQEDRFAFIEANPRLQVEHTVSEAVTGVDLVHAQLRLAAGATLAELGLTAGEISPPVGYAMQVRINLETMDAAGAVTPSGGTLSAFEPPTGPGVRVDTFGYAGYTTSASFDSLLAKLIVHRRGDYASVVDAAYRSLCEFRLEGLATNLPFLQNLLQEPAVRANRVYTRFVDEHVADLAKTVEHPRLYLSAAPSSVSQAAAWVVPPGLIAATAPMLGTVVSLEVEPGASVRAGQPLVVIEAMKMQHVVTAAEGGMVRELPVRLAETVAPGQPLLFIEPAALEHAGSEGAEAVDLESIRADLAEVLERLRLTEDAARPQAMARRHAAGGRSARENVADLCDPDSFIEYGALALAAQRTRRSMQDLIRMSPADGLVGGIGRVNGERFADERARCLVMAYDYTVFAGTQGMMNHKKTDRLLILAEQQRLPVILFAEGGGGRPGDVDNAAKVSGLAVPSFRQYARLSGLVPRISIVSGWCFAGNAVFAGCSDVIIATENTSIGMAGPAMIEGGGLGVHAPEEVGPVAVQAHNGVLDLVVADEAAAVAAAKQLLSYFQGSVADWDCADQRRLRHAVPENRLRVYDVRALIDTLADAGSVLELRRQFAPGMITAFIRVEGRPLGLIANNPSYLAGAIDADGADKASRFMQLCDAFDIPILSLCDTPGFMVGPEAEKTALVRHTSRMFVTAAALRVPFFTLVLRKAYGLGAMGMAAGCFQDPFFVASWPTGEFGPMGLEGAVRLGYRRELEAVKDPAERQALFEKMVAEAYERGKALNVATVLEIDAVIDPMASRRWIVEGLRAAPPAPPREGKKAAFVDTW